MPKTYVDNSSNRSLGRVGMPVGSAVHSSSGRSGGNSQASTSSFNSFSSSVSTARTYVDNASNRKLGRVGLPVGSAVQSAPAPRLGSSSERRTYVDNQTNRSLGRVGMEVGTAVHSRSKSSGGGTSVSTYVDNTLNRSLNRVGLPRGSVVHSASSSSLRSQSQTSSLPLDRSPLGQMGPPITFGGLPKVTTGTCRTYKDNEYNRKLKRVGLPLGAGVNYGSSSNINSSTPNVRRYVDNPRNRKLGRVGKIVGTASTSSRTLLPNNNIFSTLEHIDAEDDNLGDVLHKIITHQNEKIGDKQIQRNCEIAKGIVYRHESAISAYQAGLKIPTWLKGGELINFSDLAIGEKIGGGGFGDVFVAIWKANYQVAVKKLRVQRVSQEKKVQFQTEVRVFSSLSHPGIVKFHGVCAASPNLAIVMEFMASGSLYDVLHVEKRKLSRDQKRQMITDCLSAVKYLHDKDVTHRDIKSMNILVTEDFSHCKLGDFGLALKEETRTSGSVEDHSVVGTLRYSAPELLQGQRLSFKKLKAADIYAISIVILELLNEKEPFAGLNKHQLRQAVLTGQRPPMNNTIPLNIKTLLTRGMSALAEQRPTAEVFLSSWEKLSDYLDIEIPITENTQSTSASQSAPIKSSHIQSCTLPTSDISPATTQTLDISTSRRTPIIQAKAIYAPNLASTPATTALLIKPITQVISALRPTSTLELDQQTATPNTPTSIISIIPSIIQCPIAFQSMNSISTHLYALQLASDSSETASESPQQSYSRMSSSKFSRSSRRDSDFSDHQDYNTSLRDLLSSKKLLKCGICTMNDNAYAFSCGHLCCPDCLPRLTWCHVCRGSVLRPIRIFL